MSASQASHPFRPYNGEDLKAVPLSKLVHSVDRIEIMNRYTRAMCNILAIGVTVDQVDWVKAFLSTKLFLMEVVDSVDKHLQEASRKSKSQLIREALSEMSYGALKEAGATIVHDLFRAAAASDFPANQMETIKTFARGMGLTEESTNKILNIVENEQRLLHQNVFVSMAA